MVKCQHVNLNYYTDITLTSSAQHFQSLLTSLRDYSQLSLESLEIRNDKPSKVSKHLVQLERQIKRTTVLVSNQLRSLRMTGLTEATGFQSLVWRTLLKHNTKSIVKLQLDYKADIVREETRILCEEIGLINFVKLEELSLHMNRQSNMKEICEFFTVSNTLTSIDLSNNVLQSQDCL